MKAKRSKPQPLPLKKLEVGDFIDLLVKAHEALAHFDERIGSIKDPTTLYEFEAKYSQHKDIEGGIRALKHVCKAIEKRPFSWKILCEAHGIIKEGGGAFRKKQNWIGPEGCSKEEAFFFPPTVETMHKQLKNLKSYYSYKEIDPLIQLAIFYAQFINIHPFMDGNGRVSRIMIPLFIYKKKLTSKPLFFMSAYIAKHRDEYLRHLHAIQYKREWKGWIRFFLKGIIDGPRPSIK